MDVINSITSSDESRMDVHATLFVLYAEHGVPASGRLRCHSSGKAPIARL